jgi:hypothetical protein
VDAGGGAVEDVEGAAVVVAGDALAGDPDREVLSAVAVEVTGADREPEQVTLLGDPLVWKLSWCMKRSALRVAERGERELGGVPGRWRLFSAMP